MVHRVQGRSQERGISEAGVGVLAETPLPPPLPHGATRHPQPGKSPLQSAAVFSMQMGSRAGAEVPLHFLGEAVGREGREPLRGYALVSVSLSLKPLWENRCLEVLSTGSCSSSDGSGARDFQWLVGCASHSRADTGTASSDCPPLSFAASLPSLTFLALALFPRYLR